MNAAKQKNSDNPKSHITKTLSDSVRSRRTKDLHRPLCSSALQASRSTPLSSAFLDDIRVAAALHLPPGALN
jgi:hypothetical protein